MTYGKMERNYFLLDGEEHDVGDISELLRDLGLKEQHIHVIVKPGSDYFIETQPEEILQTSPQSYGFCAFHQGTKISDRDQDREKMEREIFIPAFEQCVALDGLTGTLGGLVAIAFRETTPVIAGGILLANGFAGASIGTWIRWMIDTDNPENYIEIENEIDEGKVLMIFDITDGNVPIEAKSEYIVDGLLSYDLCIDTIEIPAWTKHPLLA